MSKSKDSHNVSASKTGISKVLIIVIVTLVVVIVAGALATFVWRVGPVASLLGLVSNSADSGSDVATSVVTIKPEQQKSLETTKSEIEALVAKGDPESLGKADEVAKAEIQAASSSGNDSYVIMAELARANLLIDTNRAQEALDSILMPLLDKYASNEVYSNDIYVAISLAYSSLGNTDKSSEYIEQASGRGGQ